MSGNAKGLLFNHLRDWAIANHGPDAWQQELSMTSASVQEIYGGLVLTSSWHPMAAWNNVVDVFFRSRYREPNVGMTAFCAHLGQRELTSLVKMVLRIGSPEFMMKRTGFLWKRYFNSGSFGAAEVQRGHWKLWLEGTANPEHDVGPLTCANGPAPWLERGLQLGGALGTVRHTRCRYEGARRCEYVARWQA